MKCKKCGIELRENAKFCSECGEKVIKELKCKQCGNILKPNSKFCDQCGTKVDVNDSTETVKKSVSIDFNNLAGQSIGACDHNQSRWVRQYDNYIYICKDKKLYKIDINGNNCELFYESKDSIENININKNGIVINGCSYIEMLDFNGKLIDKIYLEAGGINCTYMYDNQIFFSINSVNEVKICRDEFGHHNYKIINSSGQYDTLSYLIANGKYVIFKKGTYGNFYIMDTSGLNLQKIYSHDENSMSGEIDIIYFDMDNDCMYTSAFESEKGESKNITHQYIVKRKITNNIIEGVFEEIIWNQDTQIIPTSSSIFYRQCFINNEYTVLFKHGHTKDYSDREDHYYNLYAVYNGNGYKYLNCGSRSGIETLICDGQYAYWNDYDHIYQVKIDGTEVKCLDNELQ